VSISVSGLTRVAERLARRTGRAGQNRRPRPRPTGCPHPRGIRPAGGGLPHPLAGMREHVTNHLADLDLAAFTHAMSDIATAETGPASPAPPAPSLTKLPPASETTGPQAAPANRLSQPAVTPPERNRAELQRRPRPRCVIAPDVSTAKRRAAAGQQGAELDVMHAITATRTPAASRSESAI
jgi:hypothetical protein